MAEHEQELGTLVENLEATTVGMRVRVRFQQPLAKAVDGTNEHLFGLLVEKTPETITQACCRFTCERGHEDRCRWHTTRSYQVRHAAEHHLGLPGSRPGNHQERSVTVYDHRPLLRGERRREDRRVKPHVVPPFAQPAKRSTGMAEHTGGVKRVRTRMAGRSAKTGNARECRGHRWYNDRR